MEKGYIQQTSPTRLMQFKCGLALLGMGLLTILFVLTPSKDREWYRRKLAEALDMEA